MPDGDARRLRQIVDLLGVGQAADARRLDVDDVAGVQFNRPSCMIGGDDAFVQAERRLDHLLELGVIEDVIVIQRLFVEEQVELVQLGQVIGVGEVIDAVAVDLQHEIGPTISDGGGWFDVPARFDLDFDAFVAFGQVAVDAFQERGNVLFDADADADLHTIPRTAQELGQAHVLHAGKEIPHGELKAGFGHAIGAHACEDPAHVLGRGDVGGQQHRPQELLLHQPRRLVGFLVVPGAVAHRRLAPAGHAVGVHAHDDGIAAVVIPAARLKAGDIGKCNAAQFDSFDFHRFVLLLRVSFRSKPKFLT